MAGEQARLDGLSKGWPERLDHSLHPHHPLRKTLRPDYRCSGCDLLGKDWSYHCALCNFDLHPACATEPPIHHPPERIALEMVRTALESYWCGRCAEEGGGWAYRCEDYGVDVHPTCALERGEGPWPAAVAHRLHPEHDLARARKEAYLCNRCWREGRGWSFCCALCDVDLHPRCAFERSEGGGSGAAREEPPAPRTAAEDLDAEQAKWITMMGQFQQMKLQNDAFQSVVFGGIDSAIKAQQVALRIPTLQQPHPNPNNFFAPNKYFKPF